MNSKKRWRFTLLALLIPLAIPLLAGGYWLWLNHWLFWWLAASAGVALAGWSINRLAKRFRAEPKWLDISQNIIWTQQSEQAWQRIEAISLDERNREHDLGNSEFYLQTLTRVMNDVAEVYYPQQKQAILEIKIPYLLKVIEVFAQELRINFTENVPGSHIFSLNDLTKGQKIANKGRELYRLFRIVSAGIDPVSAVIRELKIFANANLLSDSAGDIKRWLIDAYIKKIGYYAIELYSGNLTLDDDAFNKPTRQSQREMDKIRQQAKTMNAEPFKMLVLGQTNAGKASLINALAGRPLAITDPAPAQADQQTYLLQRDIFPAALIVDSRRYQDMQTPKNQESLLRQAQKSDLVVIVVSAINPAYQIDKSMLDSIKQLGNCPRAIVVLSQIDRLRPLREWQPPYNLASPCSPKAAAIQQAIANIARQLNIDAAEVVPVSLRAGQPYNCREQLIPTILQRFEHEADKRRYSRCLADYKRNTAPKRLWRQMHKAGYWASRWGIRVFNKQRQAVGA